ncbi:uncharacterized protein [Palaemon carinicauda]|uniref:uncharacterized protein n=1 Tax=Palaemon carinicauda TaxID=392227 RepID=UPI0035B5ED11
MGDLDARVGAGEADGVIVKYGVPGENESLPMGKNTRIGFGSWYVDAGNAMIIKQLQALSFVPPDDVYDCFNTFIETLHEETDSILDEFLQYFEMTWMGILQRGRRRRPTFEISLWSVYERTSNDLPRTNNMLEGWHSAFKRRVTIIHPTEDKLIRKLRSEQASTEMALEQVFQGKSIGRRNKKYAQVNDRLKKIVDSYSRENVLEYLQAIAHNL